MRAFRSIVAMDLANLFTSGARLAYGIGLPIALVLVIGFLTRESFGQTVTSYDYCGVALMIYATFNAATLSASSFMDERIRRANMRVEHAPVQLFCIHFSKVVATFIFSAVSCVAVGAVLRASVGVDYGGRDLWMICSLLALSILFFSALGVAACCALKSERSANLLLGLALTLIAVLGGLFFPLDALGDAAIGLSWLSPAKWLLTACLQIIYDHNACLLAPSCALLAALSAVMVAVSAALFKGGERP